MNGVDNGKSAAVRGDEACQTARFGEAQPVPTAIAASIAAFATTIAGGYEYHPPPVVKPYQKGSNQEISERLLDKEGCIAGGDQSVDLSMPTNRPAREVG